MSKIRFITATSLFDGHDAAIHIMRRILQSEGAEVIHLGHNRSVQEVVQAAIQEDAHGIAVSCYQGGHVEYFSYMLELLKQHDAGHIKIFGGGGGVISPDEIKFLEKHGVTKIFSPNDGLKMGLVGMIQFMIKACQEPVKIKSTKYRPGVIAREITKIETSGQLSSRAMTRDDRIPTLGFTGTGGAGKSCLIDELLLRYLREFPDHQVAV